MIESEKVEDRKTLPLNSDIQRNTEILSLSSQERELMRSRKVLF